MAIPLRSIRLTGRSASSYTKSTGESGELMYDNTNKTLRVFDGRTNGGAVLADRDWVLDNTSNFSGNYNDLSNKPVLFSGSYNDLTNKPTIPSLPTLATVATSGNYNDLSNKPASFSGSYNDLTNVPTIPSLVGYATETYVNTAISNLVDSSPATLNTLNELAAALGDDPNFATSVATSIGLKAPINNPTFTESVNLNSSVDGYVANITGNGTSLGLKLDNSNLSSSAFSIITVAGGDAGQNVSLVAGGAAGKTSLEVDAADFHLRVTRPNKDIYIDVNYNQTALKISGADKSTTFYGTLTTQQSTEVLNLGSSGPSNVTYNFSQGAIWYHSFMYSNVTANITNVPTTDNRTVVVTAIVSQGATAYIPNAVQIDGMALTIKWLGGTVPTGNANKVDIVSFTLIRAGSAWTVLGSLSTYG